MNQLVTHTASGRRTSHLSQSLHSSLLNACARRAAAMDTADIQRVLPTFSRADISYLRTRKGKSFGFERLLMACEAFDIPFAYRVGEAA
jgi:hypothetical protein